MKRAWRLWMAGFVLVAISAAWFIWPTPWAYGVEYRESPFLNKHGELTGKRVPMRTRTNRITGERQNQGGPEGEWGHFVW